MSDIGMSGEGISEEEITGKVLSLYADAVVDIEGEGCNFELFVVSDAFTGMTPLKRQQSLLNLFAEELTSGRLHALGIRARTRAEVGGGRSDLVQLEF